MSKFFRNLRSNTVEEVTHPEAIEQMEKHPEVYQPVDLTGQPLKAAKVEEVTEVSVEKPKKAKK